MCTKVNLKNIVLHREVVETKEGRSYHVTCVDYRIIARQKLTTISQMLSVTNCNNPKYFICAKSETVQNQYSNK